jgi:5-methylcytosine-specific restriction protein A
VICRARDEWIGKTPDTPVPLRVRVRQFERDGGICQCGCDWPIFAGDKWETDHKVAIINGGENRESNLRTLLKSHHKTKTAADVAEKAKVYRKRLNHLGLKRRKGPPMAGSKASGFKRKMDGSVERRR